ncbi:MAG: RidA family protein [Alicyclobacillus sp.]|nr:RidA family protein [Alicyclobacillus sp.]
MQKRPLWHARLHRPGGPYSQALEVQGGTRWLFISGLTALDADGNVLGEEDIVKQTEVILENMQGLLAEAGGTMDNVVKTTLFVTDMSQAAQVRAVRSRFFREPYSTSTMVEVSRLGNPKCLIEIEALAVL